MQWHVIQSTRLAAIAYDRNKPLLYLKFRDRTIYSYSEVPGPVFEALLRAPSKGQYFNEHTRGHFAYQRRASRQDKSG